MKKILVTGGNGFLGNFFATKLKKFYSVKSLGVSKKNDYRIDLLNEQKINLFFKKKKFDYIIHCAGNVPGKGKNSLKKKHYIQNHVMTKNIVKFSNSKIIFISSYKVYQNQTRVGFPYKINNNQINDYSSSKIVSENLIINKKKKLSNT